MNEVKRECSICNSKKHIGFINFVTNERYRLCYNHYMKWLLTTPTITINTYILTQSHKENKEQTQIDSNVTSRNEQDNR